MYDSDKHTSIYNFDEIQLHYGVFLEKNTSTYVLAIILCINIYIYEHYLLDLWHWHVVHPRQAKRFTKWSCLGARLTHLQTQSSTLVKIPIVSITMLRRVFWSLRIATPTCRSCWTPSTMWLLNRNILLTNIHIIYIIYIWWTCTTHSVQLWYL